MENKLSVAQPAALASEHARISASVESVSTRVEFCVPPNSVWSALMFYEEIQSQPPALLKLVLPRPIKTLGRKSDVGDMVQCQYDTGYIFKRVTRIDPERMYAFDVTEQKLQLSGGIQLLGGSFQLHRTASGNTEITLETRYTSTRWPRWFWSRVEAKVCHAFHNHILNEMRRKFA